MYLKDRHEINSTRVYTDEGFLIVNARLSRTGIQEYFAGELGLTDRDPTDIIKVFRPDEEVFSDESLASFANKPVTNNHPPELVNADNIKKYSVGHAGAEVVRDGIFSATKLHIVDASAVKSVEDGKVEISNGYTSDLEFKSGITPDGKAFDAIQRNIRGNHIALVDRGRCGAACKVSDSKPVMNGEPTMATVTIDGVDFEVNDQAKQAVNKLQASLRDAENETKKKETEDKDDEDEKDKDKEKMEKDHKATLDALTAKYDDAKSKIPGPDALDQLVSNRMDTRDAARKIDAKYDFVGKDCEAIRKEIVLQHCDGVTDTASVDYIRARFDALSAPITSRSTLDAGLQQQIVSGGTTKTVNTVDAARQKMMDRARNAWQKKETK